VVFASVDDLICSVRCVLHSKIEGEMIMPGQLMIAVGARILATLTHHDGTDTIEFHAFIDANLSDEEREIVLRNYLNELLKGQ
jgi:hypothetical protein